jgi:hypothetical protein
MLSDWNDSARLGFLAFACVYGETHLVSHGELVETIVCHRIAMDVDFRAIARLDETKALLGNQIGDPAAVRSVMSLDISALAASMVLELLAHRLEAIAHGNMHKCLHERGALADRASPRSPYRNL